MSDQEYPEILADLAEQIARSLVSRGMATDIAADLGRESAEHIRRHWGGQLVYISKGVAFILSKRDMEIWEKWNGRNTLELCREYEITLQRLYQILNARREREVKKRQVRLFD